MVYQPKVYREQGASSFVVASGGTIRVEAGGLINAASGQMSLPTNLRRGFIPLNLFGARIMSSDEAFESFIVSATGAVPGAAGGLIHAGSIPNLAVVTTAAQAAYVNWASGQQQGIRCPPLPVPPDFDSSAALTVHLMAERTSDNASNNVFDFRFWNTTNTTELGTTGTTLGTAPGEHSITVAAAGLTAHPGMWNVGFVPGTHTNNAVRAFTGWIEYNRRTS